MNGDTYEAIDEKYTALGGELATANETITERDNTINSLNEEISARDTKIEELGSEIATLNQEKEDAIALHAAATEQITSIQASLDEANNNLATVTTERDSLAAFQKKIQDDEKKNLINGYANQLPEEVIESYINSMDNYSLEDLDMKLTYEIKKNHPDIFSKGTPPAYIPKDNGPTGGLNAILAKYKK